MREKLIELLAKYFDIGDSYAYNLTRVKSAFACGTMGFDDFEEFDDETVADIADHLIANGVTVQEWISVKDRLPDQDVRVLVWMQDNEEGYTQMDTDRWSCTMEQGYHWIRWGKRVTHWMPLPEPPREKSYE